MDKRYFLIPILVILLIGVFVISFPKKEIPQGSLAGTIDYHSNICKTVIRADGTIEPTECSSNVLYNTGKEVIESYIGAGGGGGDAVDWIELGNASASTGTPQADKSEDYTAYGAVCGLDKVAGTYNSLTSNGNWTIHNEFTSTCDGVNTSMVRFVNADGDDFSGNEFSLVTLQTDDKLLINGTFWIE